MCFFWCVCVCVCVYVCVCVCICVCLNILRYVTFNLEVGENGTPHLQIHAQSKEKLTATAWQKALGGRVGNIVATKSKQDCIDYFQGFIVKSDRTQRKLGSQDCELPSTTGHLTLPPPPVAVRVMCARNREWVCVCVCVFMCLCVCV